MANSATAIRAMDVAWEAAALPFVQSFIQTAWATGAVNNLGGFVAPCDLILQEIGFFIGAAATSADANVNLGIAGDDDSLLDAFNVQNTTGFVVIDADDPDAPAALVSRYVPKGTYVKFQLEAATAVGNIAGYAVWLPAITHLPNQGLSALVNNP